MTAPAVDVQPKPRPEVEALAGGSDARELQAVAVRAALGTKSSWMLLNFLVNAEPRLGNRKPIDLLKAGDVGPVVEAAHRMGNQGA